MPRDGLQLGKKVRGARGELGALAMRQDAILQIIVAVSDQARGLGQRAAHRGGVVNVERDGAIAHPRRHPVERFGRQDGEHAHERVQRHQGAIDLDIAAQRALAVARGGGQVGPADALPVPDEQAQRVPDQDFHGGTVKFWHHFHWIATFGASD